MATYGEGATTGTGRTFHTPDRFSNEVVQIVNQMKRLLQASSMQEHFDALAAVDEHVLWDGPFAYTEDKDKLRVLQYFGKLFATADLDPQMVSITTSPRGRVMLESYQNYLLKPRRNLLLWWNYLLPRVFKLSMDWDMELNDKDKVGIIRSRFHNWPTLPAFMRQLATWMVAQPLVWTEPIWSQLVHFMGDYTYQREWEARQGMFGQKEGYETGYGGYGGAGYGGTGYGGTTGATGYGGTSAGTGYGGTTGTYGGTTGMTGTTGTTGTTATTGKTGTTGTAGTTGHGDRTTGPKGTTSI